MTHENLTRRNFMRQTGCLGLVAAGVPLDALAQTSPNNGRAPGLLEAENADTLARIGSSDLERRVSGFLVRDWQDHFPNRRNGAILVDTRARVLHYWDESGSIYNVYPTSVPLTPEMTRTGRTRVVQKRVGPDWRPTPNMLRRNPDLPTYVGPGPQNPLGTHAMYLTWKYYRIHGTNDTRKIGRKSSNGCIGLYNEHIQQLFDLSVVGTQVLVV